ncbi:MAG: sulfite oxidase [Gemmataceae bacterium]|nr:sulfite oxidase [Gemmata sp.]MDW8199489.1 sulfite oxidase [Gemmataceae bacterium]
MALSRRELLRSAPAAAVAAAVVAQAPSSARAEPLIVRMHEPRNLETPLSELFSRQTEKFFVRSHFAVPALDAKTLRLSVTGHVEKNLELTLDDLQAMDVVRREILLECAGNGRVFLVPPVRGLQWGHGGVGQALWTGVPLGAILARARVKPGASDVVLIGADRGTVADPPTPGAIPFDRGIPLAKAQKDETLIVWQMNDEPLSPAHGAPLRAIVGGWYGMASVKWLTQIVVLDRPHTGFWQTFDYSSWHRPANAPPQLAPITAIQPKAIITQPEAGAILPVNQPLVVQGYAWAGENRVAKVEFSSDGGRQWTIVKEITKSEPFQFVRWSHPFTPTQKQTYAFVVRCTDERGNTQAATRDPDRRTYMINHLIPIEVIVK